MFVCRMNVKLKLMANKEFKNQTHFLKIRVTTHFLANVTIFLFLQTSTHISVNKHTQ